MVCLVILWFMCAEWFVNGKPLPSGARFKSTYDFGYVSLDINHSYAEDSGVYMCKATNSKGQAQTSGTLRCTSKYVRFSFWQQCCVRLKPSGMGWVCCLERIIVVPSECQELLIQCHKITSQKAWVQTAVSVVVEYCTMQTLITHCSDG